MSPLPLTSQRRGLHQSAESHYFSSGLSSPNLSLYPDTSTCRIHIPKGPGLSQKLNRNSCLEATPMESHMHPVTDPTEGNVGTTHITSNTTLIMSNTTYVTIRLHTTPPIHTYHLHCGSAATYADQLQRMHENPSMVEYSTFFTQVTFTFSALYFPFMNTLEGKRA